jgi:hypothetical protein
MSAASQARLHGVLGRTSMYERFCPEPLLPPFPKQDTVQTVHRRKSSERNQCSWALRP